MNCAERVWTEKKLAIAELHGLMMPNLRFVHAADLHLDSPFSGLRNIAPHNVTSALHQATFDAYENTINLCLDENVDALLIAGDIYDAADRSLRAQLRFVDGLKRLDAAGVRSFVCHGNHDPLNGWEARLDLPEGCVRFGADVSGMPVFPDEPERAMVFGISYPRREVYENLSPRFRDLPQSRFNIGLLHANVGGNPNHDSYAPCSVSDLEDTDIDYWALGHVHTREILRTEGPAIVYPGNPQGRHPNELGRRGVYLVEVDELGRVSLDFRPVDVIRWARKELDISGLASEQRVLDAIFDVADSALEESEGKPVVLRAVLHGRGEMNRWLRSPGTLDEILEQLNYECSDGIPWLWCERIQLETAPAVNHEQVIQREDFIGDLARLVDELVENPEGLEDSLRELYDTQRARRYLRDLLPDNEELKMLVSAAEVECLSELVDIEEIE